MEKKNKKQTNKQTNKQKNKNKKTKNSNKKAFEKVKRKVLVQDYDKGGLKMIDMKILQSALYLSLIPKLITKSTDK